MEHTDKEIEEVVTDLTLAELKQKLDQAKHLAAVYEKRLADAEVKAHAKNIERVKELMDELGVTIVEIAKAFGYQLAARDAAPKVSGSSGNKRAPKYKDPATGDTWSGNGSRPKWLKAYIAEGRNQDEFLIKG